MSVTFWIPEAPKTPTTEECHYCEGTGHWENERVCPSCNGAGSHSWDETTAPTLNLANTNGRNIVAILNLEDDDLCGHIAPEDIASVRQQITRLRNVGSLRVPAVRVATSGGGDGSCHWMQGGYTDYQVLDRLERPDEVLAYGQDHQMRIVWA